MSRTVASSTKTDAGGLGWAAFGHLPDGWGLAGMGLVSFAGVVVALSSHRDHRQARAAMAAAAAE